MNIATPKIMVGYRTRPAVLPEPFEPAFSPPANYKDEAKIAEWQKKEREAFRVEALSYPYLSTLDEVFCVVLSRDVKDVGKWSFAGREPGTGKPPIALAMKTWLMKTFGEVWATGQGTPPIFIGFDPKSFLKIWGLELSMPAIAQPLPPSVWYGTNQHRDIRTALIPSEYPHLDLARVLKWRGIEVPNWTKPGQDPELDVRVITQAADQLGFLGE